MSDIKLFRLTGDRATELRGDASDLERPLQTLIENNLEALLGIRFLAPAAPQAAPAAARAKASSPVLPPHSKPALCWFFDC
jgi:hypothetical protein